MSSIYDGYELTASCITCQSEWHGDTLPALRSFLTTHRLTCKDETRVV